MAFSLDIALCSKDNCQNLRFTDTSLNWADASIAIGDSVYVEINVTDSASVVETYDVSAVFDAATVQSDLYYDSEDYSGGPFADGQYTINYSIYTDNTKTTLLYEVEKTVYIYCTLACCIEEKRLEMAEHVSCDSCDMTYVMNYYKMKALFENFKLAVSFGNFTNASAIYEVLEILCDIENCNCS